MKNIILFLFPLFIYAQPDCMMTLMTSESTNNGTSTTIITTYTWDGLTSSFTTSDNSSSGYITYNTNGDIVEQFTEATWGTNTVTNQYNSENQLIQATTNNSGIETTTTYTWDGLTANFDAGSYSGYITYNANGDMVEYFMSVGGSTNQFLYSYDSENRIIQLSVISAQSNWEQNYTWDGLTANFIYSGSMEGTGYQVMNEQGYMIEYQQIIGGSETHSWYEYNCPTSTLLDMTKSSHLITTVDMLGRESTNNKGFQVHIYNDGSVDKKYVY